MPDDLLLLDEPTRLEELFAERVDELLPIVWRKLLEELLEPLGRTIVVP